MRVAIFLLTAPTLAAAMAAATLLQRLHAKSSLHDKSSHHCCSSCTPNNQIIHSSLISRTCNQRKHHHHYRELRSKVMESNGRVMNCPPTSVSITLLLMAVRRGRLSIWSLIWCTRFSFFAHISSVDIDPPRNDRTQRYAITRNRHV
eukprot:scaffold19265_cov75-Skeletonema_dohrnii-CCMP3373.AAC.4